MSGCTCDWNMPHGCGLKGTNKLLFGSSAGKKLRKNFEITSFRKLKKWVDKNKPSIIYCTKEQIEQYDSFFGKDDPSSKNAGYTTRTFEGIPLFNALH